MFDMICFDLFFFFNRGGSTETSTASETGLL